MYHMIMRGMLVTALRMSTTAKFAIKTFVTVRRVLNLMSKTHIMLFPITDPTITKAINTICETLTASVQEIVFAWTDSCIAVPTHEKPIQVV